MSTSRTSGEKMRAYAGPSAPSEAATCVDTRSHAHGAPAVEGMGEGDGRGEEPDTVGGQVDVREGGGGDQERVHGRADVVMEAGER